MKNLLRSLPILALCGLLGPAVRAQTVSPVPSPTIITSAPYTISTPGFYQLGKDLTVTNTTGNIITINAGNVTLDFGGHYLSGPNNNASNRLVGVYASERGNLTIRNGTIADCYQGIFLTGNGSTTATGTLNINQRIDNMLVSYCSYSGVVLNAAYNSAVTNCRVSFIGSSINNSAGISFNGGGGGRIIGNAIAYINCTSGNSYGILAGAYAADNIIDTVTASNTAAGIFGVSLAVNNSVFNSSYGYTFCGKCRDDLTYNCTTAFFNSGEVTGND